MWYCIVSKTPACHSSDISDEPRQTSKPVPPFMFNQRRVSWKWASALIRAKFDDWLYFYLSQSSILSNSQQTKTLKGVSCVKSSYAKAKKRRPDSAPFMQTTQSCPVHHVPAQCDEPFNMAPSTWCPQETSGGLPLSDIPP